MEKGVEEADGHCRGMLADEEVDCRCAEAFAEPL